MIEEAAGTRMFEQKKQSALKTITKKQIKVPGLGCRGSWSLRVQGFMLSTRFLFFGFRYDLSFQGCSKTGGLPVTNRVVGIGLFYIVHFFFYYPLGMYEYEHSAMNVLIALSLRAPKTLPCVLDRVTRSR